MIYIDKVLNRNKKVNGEGC